MIEIKFPLFYRLICVTILAIPLISHAKIERSAKEVRAFRYENPCPATGLRRGACPGFAVDHIIPLCAGGEDKRTNMQWLSNEDHRFKTLIDERECRKMRNAAERPAKLGE